MVIVFLRLWRVLQFFISIDKYEQGKHAYGNGRIGNVENGLEEHKIFAAPERHPVRQRAIYYRYIEHIYHLALQKLAIARPKMREVRDRCGVVRLHHAAEALIVTGEAGIRTIREDEPVEHTVYQVAKCSGQYERTANNNAARIPAHHKAPEQKEAERNGNEAESGKQDFAKNGFTYLEPIGHALILYEMKPEPAAYYFHIVAIYKMGFDV